MSEQADVMVTVSDLRAAGYCAAGGRALAARYDTISWYSVRHGGVPASLLLATGDALAARVVACARARVAAEQAAEAEAEHG